MKNTNHTTEEIMKILEEQGWQPQLCDTPIPYFEEGVRAGVPTDPGDIVRGEYVFLPKDFVAHTSLMRLRVNGDSMMDAGIMDGDTVEVLLTQGLSGIHDGDTVVASLDGASTLKTFFRDEDGDCWLLPRNEKYNPIQLSEDMNVHIFGKVVAVRHEGPHASMAEIAKIMKRAQKKIREVEPPTEKQIRKALVKVSGLIKNGRMWFAAYRALVDRGVVKPEDFNTFVTMVENAVPEDEHLPVVTELRRMDLLSFRRPLSQWDKQNAPVKGSRFDDYYFVAKEMAEMLG